MLEKVIDILSEFTVLERENITKESELVNDLGLNSLDVLNVIVAFEEEFDIEIPDAEIKKFAVVEDIELYLEKTLCGSGSF